MLALLALFISTAFASDMTKVAVIDTGIDVTDARVAPYLCPGESKDFTGTGLRDVYNHGTHVTGLIIKNAGNANYCIMALKYYVENRKEEDNIASLMRAMHYAIDHGATLVNYSGGGGKVIFEERYMISSHPEITFVVAAGNEHSNLDDSENNYYPASYRLKNIVAVGSLDHQLNRSRFSNYGSFLAWEIGEDLRSYLPGGMEGYMSGTSQATAVRTGKILRSK